MTDDEADDLFGERTEIERTIVGPVIAPREPAPARNRAARRVWERAGSPINIPAEWGVPYMTVDW